tara:strand:- start:115 stop:609 length:495 start_codon:yes stop_codon:yes gene_type:complete
MKKIILLIASFFILIHISSCTGYKPIFSSTNFNFEIAKHTINGDKKLGNQIYSKLYGVSNLNKNNTASQSIEILINVSKNKTATVKNSAGKILEYRININTNIVVNDFLENKEMLNQNFEYFSSYKVQDQHFETAKLENKAVDVLIDKTYQDCLIKISEIIKTQ